MSNPQTRERAEPVTDNYFVETNPFGPKLLAGSSAIVTGGGTGLGRGIALGLAACGARVFLTGRRQDPLDETAAMVRDGGGEAATKTCDVRDPDAVAALIEAADQEMGPVDLLVNNAGATFTVPAEDLSPNAFRAVVETDAFGTFYMCQAFAKRLIAKGVPGAILNITSTSPMTGNPGRLHGAVGKAGVDSLTKSLAVEWGTYGIRVNNLAPGYTPTQGVNKATNMTSAGDEQLARVAESVPLKRVGRIEDIAWPSVFLLSPAASFVTGATLVVDGGKWLSSGRSYSPAAARPN
jgi:NAD(P)-dependent dehydrogenase (short-subunit alcohol dehydrogenase family)